MVHNYVEIVFLQLLQIHVLTGLINKIQQPKMIKIVTYGFHRLVIVKTVFWMVQMDVFPLNNALHFKEQSIHVLNILPLMDLVIVSTLQYQLVLLMYATMHHLLIIQIHNANNGDLLVWLMDKAVFRLDNAKVLDLTQYAQLIRVHSDVI